MSYRKIFSVINEHTVSTIIACYAMSMAAACNAELVLYAALVFYPMTPFERYGASLQRHTVHHLVLTIGSDLVIMRAITMAKPHPGHILVPL